MIESISSVFLPICDRSFLLVVTSTVINETTLFFCAKQLMFANMQAKMNLIILRSQALCLCIFKINFLILFVRSWPHIPKALNSCCSGRSSDLSLLKTPSRLLRQWLENVLSLKRTHSSGYY